MSGDEKGRMGSGSRRGCEEENVRELEREERRGGKRRRGGRKEEGK